MKLSPCFRMLAPILYATGGVGMVVTMPDAFAATPQQDALTFDNDVLSPGKEQQHNEQQQRDSRPAGRATEADNAGSVPPAIADSCAPLPATEGRDGDSQAEQSAVVSDAADDVPQQEALTFDNDFLSMVKDPQHNEQQQRDSRPAGRATEADNAGSVPPATADSCAPLPATEGRDGDSQAEQSAAVSDAADDVPQQEALTFDNDFLSMVKDPQHNEQQQRDSRPAGRATEADNARSVSPATADSCAPLPATEGRDGDSHAEQSAAVSDAADNEPQQEALTFDSDFLSMGKEDGQAEKHVDLSYFARKGGMAPGQYSVQVRVNDRLVDEERTLTFKSWPHQPGKLYACVSPAELLSWWGIKTSRDGESASDSNTVMNEAKPMENGVNASQADDAQQAASPSCPIGGVVTIVPYAREEFDFNKRLLSLTVPQAALGPASRLRTPVHLWDDGVPAMLMNYNYSGNQQNSHGQKNGSDFLGLNGQLNLLGWRLRSDLTGHKRQGGAVEWNLSRGYAQRNFARFGGGQLTVGHTSSSGGGVDGVAFLGVRVESDDGMLDPKLTTFTPAITGIAESPATVTVRQYGKVIYQQNVPQGPFSLTDFNRTGSGEVEVEVQEAGGRTRRFILAQGSSSVLMRQGAVAYSASAGQAANGAGHVDARFVQFGGSYGMGAGTTLTGGVLLSRDYQAAAIGAGYYAGAWGAFSYTLKGNRANLAAVPGRQGSVLGVAHAFGWSRSFGDTSVSVSYSRGQTPDARSYSEMLTLKPPHSHDKAHRTSANRDSLAVSLSQSLGPWGSLSLSGARATAWNSSRVEQSLTLGYSTTIKDVGIGLALGMSTSQGGDHWGNDGDTAASSPAMGRGRRTDRTVALSLSLPIGKWLGTDRVSNGTYSYTRTNGAVSQQSGISGSALDNSLSYSAAQTLTGSRNGSLSAGYSGGFGTVTGGYGYSSAGNSLSYGASGGLALHAGGVTLGRQLSLNGGNALVAIPGAGGIRVGNATTDWRGYALVSGLAPYDRNRVNIDVNNLPGNVELDTSSKNVVPTRGALVSVPFISSTGFRLLLTLLHRGEPVPFGAGALLKRQPDEGPAVSGIVGEAGQVYLTGMPARGTVTARWGDGPEQQCTAVYALPANADMTRLMTVSAVCR